MLPKVTVYCTHKFCLECICTHESWRPQWIERHTLPVYSSKIIRITKKKRTDLSTPPLKCSELSSASFPSNDSELSSPIYLQNTQRTVLTILPSKYSELSLPVYLQNTQNCSLLFTFKILRTVPSSLPSKYSETVDSSLPSKYYEMSAPVYLQNTQNYPLQFSFKQLRTVLTTLLSKYSELSTPVLFLQATQNCPSTYTEMSSPVYLQTTQFSFPLSHSQRSGTVIMALFVCLFFNIIIFLY